MHPTRRIAWRASPGRSISPPSPATAALRFAITWLRSSPVSASMSRSGWTPGPEAGHPGVTPVLRAGGLQAVEGPSGRFEARTELQRLLQVRDRLPPPFTAHRQPDSEAVVSLGQVRIQSNRLLELRNGIRQVARLAQEEVPKAVVGLGIGGIDGERSRIFPLRIGAPARNPGKRVGQIRMEFRVSGRQPRSLLQFQNRVCNAPG